MTQTIVLFQGVGNICQFTIINDINELSQGIGVGKKPDMICEKKWEGTACLVLEIARRTNGEKQRSETGTLDGGLHGGQMDPYKSASHLRF